MEKEILKFLESLGCEKEVLKNTPSRFCRYLQDYTKGYDQKIGDIVGPTKGLFPNSSETVVRIKQIPFSSMCQHHLAPYFGTIYVSYQPDKYIMGLSKIPKIIDMLSKRLTVQEGLTEEIKIYLVNLLQPRMLKVCISARHSCLCRNIPYNVVTITTAKYRKKRTYLYSTEL